MAKRIDPFKNFWVTEDWIKTGSKYAEKSWPYTYNRMGKSDIYQRLRNIVKGIIAQEALGHLLNSFNIPFVTKPKEKWYEVNRFDYLIKTSKGNVLIDIKSFFVPNSRPELKSEGDSFFLDCSALVPKDQLESREMKDDDIYVFAFMIGRENKKPSSDLFNAECRWLIHCFWEHHYFKPRKYLVQFGPSRLGSIELHCVQRDAGREFILGGTIEEKDYQTENIKIASNSYGKSMKSFFQLFFIRPLDNKLPSGNIEINSELDNKPIIIPAIHGFNSPTQNGWEDIWIYDARICFVGLSTKEYFKKHAEFIPRFSKTVKQAETKTDNYAISIKDLPYDIDSLPDILK